MGNDTKQNIRRKKQVKRQRRRLKLGRTLIFFLLLVLLGTAVIWSGYHLYQWGAGACQSLQATYADYQQRAEMKKKNQDPRFAHYANILLLGIDDGISGSEAAGRWADTLILVSFNRENGDVRFLSIPRDTLVNIPGRKNAERMNAAYYYGGAPLALQTTSELLGIPIQEYITIDIESLAALVDAMGGVDLYVETDMHYEDPAADLSIHLQKGYQHMDGDTAQKYLRYRSDDLGDIGRVQRQQRFIKAVYEKCSQLENLAKLPAVAEIISTKVSTSVEMLSLADMIMLFKGLRADHPKTIMLPGRSAENEPYWLPDAAKIEGRMQELFPELMVPVENNK